MNPVFLPDAEKLETLSTRASLKKGSPTILPRLRQRGGEYLMSVHDASRAAAAIPPSQRPSKDWSAINMGDQATRNADAEARRTEKIHGKKK